MKPVSKSIAASILFSCTANEKEHQAIPTTITTIAVLGPNEDTYFDTSINVKAGYKYKEVIELGVAAQITLHFPQTDKYCGESSMLYFENPEQWLDFPNYGARILLSEQP